VIAARLYRDSAVQTACGVVKDLSLLGRDLSRVVIVDNDPVSFLRHPDNAVLIRSFRGTDEDAADASFAVLQRLLEDLVPLPDVRPALAARFGLRRYFRCISPETAPEICSEIR
jgi:TFIIF-interacting CTD phosphatase-like protein